VIEDVRRKQGDTHAAGGGRARLRAGDAAARWRLRRGQGRAQERVRSLQVDPDRRALERADRAAVLRAALARAQARRNREGQGGGHGLHLQDQMIAWRAALLAALIAAATSARAQGGAQDVSPALAPAVAAYRNGDLATAEASLRPLAASNADAAAWLGAVLLDRGADREALRLIQQAADAGSAEGNHRLGLIHAQGLAGVPRNEAKAVELF